VSAGNEAVRYERPPSTRLFLAVAASAVFVSVLTATMINVLIPLIRAQFGSVLTLVRPTAATGERRATASATPPTRRRWLPRARKAINPGAAVR
jgi:hypothetical protein